MPILFSTLMSSGQPACATELFYYNYIFDTHKYAQIYNLSMQKIAEAFGDVRNHFPPKLKLFFSDNVLSQVVFGQTSRLEDEKNQLTTFVVSTLIPLFDSLLEPSPDPMAPSHPMFHVKREIADLQATLKTPEDARASRYGFFASPAGAQFGYAPLLQATETVPTNVKIAQARLKCLSMMYAIWIKLRTHPYLSDAERILHIDQLITGRNAEQKKHRNTDVMPQFDDDVYMTASTQQMGQVLKQPLSVELHLLSRGSARAIQKEARFWEKYPDPTNPFEAGDLIIPDGQNAEIWFKTNIGLWYREIFTDLLIQRYGVPARPTSYLSLLSSRNSTRSLDLNTALDEKIDELFLREYVNAVSELQDYRKQINHLISQITTPSSNPSSIPDDGRYSSDLTRLSCIPSESRAAHPYFSPESKRAFFADMKIRQDRLAALQRLVANQEKWKANAQYCVNNFARNHNIVSEATSFRSEFLTAYHFEPATRFDLCQKFAIHMGKTMQAGPQAVSVAEALNVEERTVSVITAITRMCYESLRVVLNFLQQVESSLMVVNKQAQKHIGLIETQKQLEQVKIELQMLQMHANSLYKKLQNFPIQIRYREVHWNFPVVDDMLLENAGSIQYGPIRSS